MVIEMSGQSFRKAPCNDCGAIVSHRFSDGGRLPHSCKGGRFFGGDVTPGRPNNRAKFRHDLILWAEEQERRLGTGSYGSGQRRIIRLLLEKLGEPEAADAVDPAGETVTE